jgi:hypothetical protein
MSRTWNNEKNVSFPVFKLASIDINPLNSTDRTQAELYFALTELFMDAPTVLIQNDTPGIAQKLKFLKKHSGSFPIQGLRYPTTPFPGNYNPMWRVLLRRKTYGIRNLDVLNVPCNTYLLS